ncbi:MAG: hypothetical protein H6719_15600 [Sandaracinaceae bacterium]|nr:hypothetical protein [Sandaracinaceae bacterium]
MRRSHVCVGWCVFGVLALLGCDSGGGTDGGIDAGVDVDAAAVDGGGGTDAGGRDAAVTPQPLGASCASDAECQSGVCYSATEDLELGTGYCSLRCSDTAECTGFPSDGHTYACAPVPGGPRCARVCPGGVGCQDGDFCVEDFGGNPAADVCLDLSGDACTSNADCSGANDLCTILADRERAVSVCFHGRGFDGMPLPFKAVGDTCTPPTQPPCTTTADCPSGFRCQRRADGRDVCNPMPSETCHLFCLLPGVCTGLCAADADCPTDMRCSGYEFGFVGNTPGAFDDAPYTHFGICTYAAGSRTSCATEVDCDATGTGGADEVCWPTASSAGGPVAPICVTPSGVAQPGEVCGDDPTTDAVEDRPCDGNCIFNRCAGVCRTSADCATGQCIQIDQSATARSGACVGGATCTSDGDCGAGEVCNQVIDATGMVFHLCTPAQGALAGGSVCEVEGGAFVPVSQRCDLGCEDTGRGRAQGRCQDFCTTDADCPSADFVCGQLTLTVGSGGTFPDRTDDTNATLRVCQYEPGSRTACAADGDCAAGELCGLYFDATGASVRGCVDEVAGGAAAGEACDLDGPCRFARGCLPRWDDPAESFCTALCARDSDCPASFQCRRPSLGTATDQPLCFPMLDPRGLPL